MMLDTTCITAENNEKTVIVSEVGSNNSNKPMNLYHSKFDKHPFHSNSTQIYIERIIVVLQIL